MPQQDPYGGAAVADLPDDGLDQLSKVIRQERRRRSGRWGSCLSCRSPFAARRGARYCSGRCRTAAYRERLRGEHS